MDDNLDLFGRDSDSDSASSEASATENAPFPGGGATGGFQGLVQGAIVKLPEAGSGIEEGGATLRGAVARDDGSDEAPPVEGKEEVGEGLPGSPPRTQGGAQPKKTPPRPVYEGKAESTTTMAHRGYADIVRELIATDDGSVEHLRMKDEAGDTALDITRNVEVKALLTAAEAAADTGPLSPRARPGREMRSRGRTHRRRRRAARSRRRPSPAPRTKATPPRCWRWYMTPQKQGQNQLSPRSASSSTRASTFDTRCVYPVCVCVLVLEY
jgi:hypothetical protein